MGGKSKRYFQSSRARSRSKSPDRNLKSHRSSSSYSSQTKQPKSRSSFESNSKYSENKSASERLKKTFQEKTTDLSVRPSTIPTVAYLSVEEQLKRANAIEEINYNPFQPKSFISNRNLTFHPNSVNFDTSSIPLPRDDNSWRENPKLLIDHTLFIGNAEERKQKWYDNLLAMREKLQKTGP